MREPAVAFADPEAPRVRRAPLLDRFAEAIADGLDPDAAEARVAAVDRVWRPHAGPQAYLMRTAVRHVGYGGARGGGKSDGAAGRWLAHEAAHGRSARGIIVRRFYKDLEDLVRRFAEIFGPTGAEWKENRAVFVFPSGARLYLRHVRDAEEALRYKGRSFNWLVVEEAQDWPDLSFFALMRSSLRSPEGIPVFSMLTFNPGGPGHVALKHRYITNEPHVEHVFDYVNSKGEQRQFRVFSHRDEETGEEYEFIEAKLEDNPSLTEKDPTYEARMRDVGPELYAAWRHGNWDIVAGAALSDVWSDAVHVVGQFPLPDGWTLDRSLDWGSSHPFAVVWWAEADGVSPVPLWGMEEVVLPRGSLVAFREWYGWNGKPNKGSQMLASEVGRGILARERDWGVGGRVRPGPADTQIFQVINGPTIASDFATVGVTWTEATKGPNSRATGLEMLRRMLKATLAIKGEGRKIEEPCLLFCSDVHSARRTLPALPRNRDRLDDVDTDSEDHFYDAVRYRVTMRRPQRAAMVASQPLFGV